jgi:N-acetylmuramoyl-L-alanine amidase
MKKRLKIGINYSLNFNPLKRNKKKIKFIVVHYTGMKKEFDAIKKLCSSSSKVSSHYFIKENGVILNLVPDLYEAWHAGKSCWKNYKLLNKYSIGIEIHNPGHQHGYKKFKNVQISSLIKLLKKLSKKYKISKNNILGHSDIAPNRKKDPGEKFPWKVLAKNKLCYLHNTKKSKISRDLKISSKDKRAFLKNLYRYGYCKINNVKLNKNSVLLTKAFQRRFRQDLVNGIIDKECFLISKSLLNNQ